MEKAQKKECSFEGKNFAHGSELCDFEKCVRCNDGQWEDRLTDMIFGFGP